MAAKAVNQQDGCASTEPISLSTGAAVEVGLEPVQIVLLALTLLVSIVNLGGGRTNILQGAVHLIVFLAYAVLIFD